MLKHEAQELLKRYNTGNCTDLEKELVESWYLQYEPFKGNDIEAKQRAADLEVIWSKLPVNRPVVRRLNAVYRVAAAAIVLLFLSLGIYYSSHRTDQDEVIQKLSKNLQPGGNKAILTLSNGQKIVLTGAGNGKLADQNEATVIKTDDGELLYTVANAPKANQLAFNTMTTPPGGTYHLTLSDGTKVSLDAGSSISYPVSFTGKERSVDVTGQAYFEVAHNAAKPFLVHSKGQTIKVLGTHFNVNAFEDEKAITTTLLQGSIEVQKGGQTALLQPGEQAIIIKGEDKIKVSTADTETAVAWQQGMFRFKRADLPTVMRQFARWYDVDVVYEGEVPNVAITGKVQRTANASQVLKIVNKLGLKFKADGRKIIILAQ